ncbi:MAG TPA: SurA N-terminal domain-containing protein [Acidobacteriaceae bacterium]|nr:SurA N-terminal domain-containing protein [Acidobacteriaceae bacterium]
MSSARMTHLRFSLPTFVAAGVLAIALSGCKQAPGPDVLATVNGKSIVQADVDRIYKQSVGEAADQQSKEQAATQRLNILHQMIVDEIMQQRAAKLNLVATDEEVDAKLTDMKALSTQEEFNQQLKQKGLTLDDLRREIRRSLTVTKLQNKEIFSKVNISDAQISAYYNAHKSDYNLVEPRYHIARIVVSNEPAKQVNNLQGSKATSDADAKKKIQSLRSSLEAGQDFQSVAARFSEDPSSSSNGGDFGLIPESQLQSDPEIFNAISKLKPGQITDTMPMYRGEGSARKVIGYAIYKLIEKSPAGQRELNDPNVQQSIRQFLRNSQAQMLETAYSEMLYNEAKIHNYLAEQILHSGGV